jgi:hypothetical protein
MDEWIEEGRDWYLQLENTFQLFSLPKNSKGITILTIVFTNKVTQWKSI